jgi:putative Ca2+/H+ antiporter (TMEM165/GDT1 family)
VADLIHALDRSIVLALLTCAVLVVLLGNMVAMTIHLHDINTRLAAFTDRFAAVSDMEKH